MENAHIEKNRLDLMYHRSLQEHNAILILATTGALAFIGTYVWNQAYIKGGALLSGFIWIFCFLWYRQVNQNLEGILGKLDKLKK